MQAATAAFGVGASPGTAEKVKGNARIVLLCGLLSFIFLLAAAIDPAWVVFKQDTTFTGGSGQQETGQAVGKFGLTRALVSQPTYDSASKTEFTLTIVYPPNVLVQQINAGNEFRDGPQASSGDTPATAFVPIAMVLVAVAMICTATRYLAGSDCCSPTCGCVTHWAAGVCAVLGGVLGLVAVIIFATADIEKAICWGQTQDPKPDNASCGFGGAFAVAIVGSLFALGQGAAHLALIKMGDISAVQGEVKSSNPLGMV